MHDEYGLPISTDTTSLVRFYDFEQSSQLESVSSTSYTISSGSKEYYHIGTQPDGVTNPLAVIDELHIHADAEETVVEKSYDRGDADFTLVDTVAFSSEGAQVQFADTTITAGDSPIYKISSYNLLGETELQTLVQGITVSPANAPQNLAGSSNSNATIIP